MPLIRGIVEEVRNDKVVLKGDIVLGYDRIAGLPIDEDLLGKLGFDKSSNPTKTHMIKIKNRTIFMVDFDETDIYEVKSGVVINSMHRLQNLYHDHTDGEELTFNVPEPPPIHPQQ